MLAEPINKVLSYLFRIQPGNGWDRWEGPLPRIPRNRREVYEVFGSPGQGEVDEKWMAQNIITVRDLPGVPSRWYFKCHKLAEPYLREGLRRAAHASDYQIRRAGGFNFRHIRHDPKRPLSMHSWGIAIDIDAQQNWYKQYKRGQARPKAWSKEYMRIWPKGVDRAFVEAMQSVGFTWGSDWDNDGEVVDHTFLDPMHFELVDRK